MSIKYVHTNIIGKSWKKLAQFYVDVFECKIILPERDISGKWLDQATNLKNAHIHGAHLKLPGYEEKKGPTLEIFEYDDPSSNGLNEPNTLGFGHIAFQVPNVSEISAKVIDHGGSVVGELVEKEIDNVGKLEFQYVRDPEGNIVEVQKWSLI